MARLTEQEQHLAWMKLAYEEASKSPDTSTHVGALLVIGDDTPWRGDLTAEFIPIAHNGPTRGWVLQPEDHERPRKYQIFEHAERRAIYRAAEKSWPTKGTTMIGNWAACVDCSRAIVEAGIVRLIRHKLPEGPATPGWEESVNLGDQILRAGGVEILEITGPIPGAPKVLKAGEWFDPSS